MKILKLPEPENKELLKKLSTINGTFMTVLFEVKYLKQIQSLFTKYIPPFSKIIVDYYIESIRYECN